MNSSRLLFLSMVLLFNMVHPNGLYSQGCSDAGFCSIGDLAMHKKDSSDRKSKITFSIPIGQGDESVLVVTPALQYDLTISDAWAAQLKVTANYADGNLGAASGVGDVYLSGIHALSQNRKLKLSLTLGLKVPLNSADLDSKGRPLPMQYQSSLGTTDLIAGITGLVNSWQFTVGWQRPLSGRNDNRFLPASWNTTEAQRYPPSNQLERRSDALLRLSYNFLARPKVSVNGGILAVYHLADDTYMYPNSMGSEVPIKGSHGLTLNLTAAFTWKINSNLQVGFNAGAPVITREVRPDGLTRSFVFAPEIQWSF